MVVPAEFVLDTSFAIPWIFRDEVNSLTDKAWQKLIDGSAAAHVPGLWPMEMVNVSMRGPRKGNKPSKSDVEQFFAILGVMPLRVHHQGIEAFLDHAPGLMRKYGLSAYDCAYLMLAIARKLPLATRDEKMQKAALGEGIKVIA